MAHAVLRMGAQSAPDPSGETVAPTTTSGESSVLAPSKQNTDQLFLLQRLNIRIL
jgi:hypothetical protein